MENVIQIKSDEIIENLDDILQNCDIFHNNSNLEAINCYIFYTENKKLLNYKKYEVEINNNKLKKKELLSLILKNNKHHSKKFDLISIFKYEVGLEEDKIKEFCQNPQEFDFLTEYRNLQDICFQPGIEMLNDQNCIMLIFSRNNEVSSKKEKDNNKTKKRVKFNMKDSNESKANKTMKTI